MARPKLSSVKPVAITPAMMISTDVPEDDAPAYVAATTYAAGEKVIYEHVVYESVAGSNQGNTPLGNTDKWRPVSPTNRWKIFDKSIGSQTKKSTEMTYSLKIGSSVNYLGVLNATAVTSVRVRVQHPTLGTIYDKTINLRRFQVSSGWWNFYFGQRTSATQSLFNDLNAIPGTTIVVDFSGGTDMGVGVLLVGVRRDFTLGVKAGAMVGYIDTSRKGRDEYGNAGGIVERPAYDIANFSMLVKSSEVDSFKIYVKECRAIACLWIGSDRYESTTIYGFPKDFRILLNYYDYADSELELESLT